MAKRKRREQQHLRQETARRKSYSVGGTSPQEIYRPGFPMNMLGNLKIFSIIGVGVAALMVLGAFLTMNQQADTEANPDPTETSTATGTETPSATAEATPTALQFSAAEDVIDETANEYSAVVKTSMGDFTIRLYAEEAPNTVNSFVFLAENDYFDGITFHRVAQNFVIQSGDPTGSGSGGPGYNTNDEPNEIRNTRGTIAMAKAGTNKFFGSQFFVNLKDNPALDFDSGNSNVFYPFAEVTEGMDVVDAIGQVEVDRPPDGRPLEDVIIEDVEIVETPKS